MRLFANTAYLTWRRALRATLVGAVALLGLAGCATLIVTGAVDPNAKAEQAVEIAAAVNEALRADAGLDASDVRASASGTVVTLNGSVPTASQRERAVAVTAATPGVTRVVDRLSLGT
ncbi:MAG: BON domain-containing protein [Pseudomonadota bacterium]